VSNHSHEDPIVDAADRHAFVVLGTQTIFLCHLTMFHMEDHMYQLVLRVRFSDYGMRQYLHERKDNPNTTFFLGNSDRDLLTLPEIQTGTRASFCADVFRDIPDKPVYDEWPWTGIPPAIDYLPVTVERVVCYRHFDFNLGYPEKLSYMLFGFGNEAHMTNYQTREWDFDQVVSLLEAPQWLPLKQLEAGVGITIPALPIRPAGEKTYCSDPLTKATYDVTYAGKRIPANQITIGYHHWFSTKIVNETNPCAPPPKQKVRYRPWRE